MDCKICNKSMDENELKLSMSILKEPIHATCYGVLDLICSKVIVKLFNDEALVRAFFSVVGVDKPTEEQMVEMEQRIKLSLAKALTNGMS